MGYIIFNPSFSLRVSRIESTGEGKRKKVIEVRAGTPAAEARLKKGDIVIRLDGRPAHLPDADEGIGEDRRDPPSFQYHRV